MSTLDQPLKMDEVDGMPGAVKSSNIVQETVCIILGPPGPASSGVVRY